jgi:hypothetical protein
MAARFDKRSASAQPWSIPMAAVFGVVAGTFLATICHLCHDHAGYTSEALVRHFIPQLIVAVTVCAALFALDAASLERLKRKRQFRAGLFDKLGD